MIAGRDSAAAALLLLLAMIYPIAGHAGPVRGRRSGFPQEELRRRPCGIGRQWRAPAIAACAQLGMATLYYSGLPVRAGLRRGVRMAEPQGGRRQACRGGSVCCVAAMYRDGKGVEQDQVKALALFRQAASHDVPGAFYSMSSMYFTGQGVAVDYDEAYYRLSLRGQRDGQGIRPVAVYGGLSARSGGGEA